MALESLAESRTLWSSSAPTEHCLTISADSELCICRTDVDRVYVSSCPLLLYVKLCKQSDAWAWQLQGRYQGHDYLLVSWCR
jgi:hypothetical protein